VTSRTHGPRCHPPHSACSHRNVRPLQECGVSLLEVLIALLVLSVGLLGLAALQSGALQGNQASLMHSKATNLAYDVTDRMRANRGNLGEYETGFSDFENEIANTCNPNTTGDELHDADIKQWKAAVRCSLPGGEGLVVHSNGVTRVTIRWIERRLEERQGSNTGWETLTIETRI
jgi:type IV pilus assembly protein PilV